MKLLSLDIGTRRTGVAFCDTSNGIPLPLDSIRHTSSEELVSAIQTIVASRFVDRVIIGLPLLLSGAEGSQSTFVRSISDLLVESGIHCEFLDERYTTPKNSESDGDAAAACTLLSMALERI